MEYIRQVAAGDKLSDIFDIPQAFHSRMAEVIILFSDEHETVQKTTKRPIGFAKGAEIPDSFFEPLSDEDLQLWGL
jgi:predicted oxidoreductase (fatty acid repression mutant protein)